MGKTVTAVLLALLVGCASIGEGIKSADVATEPTVYATVVSEPDPLLLGGWKTTFVRYISETGEHDYNPIQYYLMKDGDRYALYFYRTAHRGRKRYIGWRDWTVYGDEIRSNTGIRFFTADGKVYFQWRDEKPIEMERIKWSGAPLTARSQ